MRLLQLAGNGEAGSFWVTDIFGTTVTKRVSVGGQTIESSRSIDLIEVTCALTRNVSLNSITQRMSKKVDEKLLRSMELVGVLHENESITQLPLSIQGR
jgi:hypothetical protein